MTLMKELLPGSIPFLLATFLVGMVFHRWDSTKKWGRRWLWAVFFSYLVFSVPVTSRWLAAPLGWGFAPLTKANSSGKSTAVVVLDSGTSRYGASEGLVELPNSSAAMRALEVVRVYRLLDAPIVIVSGGDRVRGQDWAPEASALRDLVVKLGVPFERVILDSESKNTREHSVNIVRLLRQQQISNFVLVTSATHMRRALAAFRVLGANPIPSPSSSLVDAKRGWDALWPSSDALLLTQEAMHDYFGLVYYRFQGWL